MHLGRRQREEYKKTQGNQEMTWCRTSFALSTYMRWGLEKIYIVENVPAEVCRQCGERYYHATTLDAIDALLKKKHRVKKKLQVEVVTL